MADFYQYQIEVNNERRNAENAIEAWKDIARSIDARGGVGRLYRRWVTNQSWVDDWNGGEIPEGYYKIGEHVVGSWEIFAEVIS